MVLLGAGLVRLGARFQYRGAASVGDDGNVREMKVVHPRIRVHGFRIRSRDSNQVGAPQLSVPIPANSVIH